MISVAQKLLILMRRKSDSSICRGSEKIIYVVQYYYYALWYFWESYDLKYRSKIHKDWKHLGRDVKIFERAEIG